MQLIVHRNPEAVARGINPFDRTAPCIPTLWKTEGPETSVVAVRIRCGIRRRTSR